MTTADVSLDTFVNLATKSRVVDPAVVARLMARARPGSSGTRTPPPLTARGLAEALVKSGDLTRFQAEKLLRGLWQGLAVGPYRILAPLGRGGMGTVYLARDSRLAEELGDDVLVALKVLPPRIASEERMLVRFRREIEIGKRVSHPNVVRLLGGGEADGVNYIAMEYVPGKTMQWLVTTGGRRSVGEAASVFADVAAGLAYLHEQGIIHRDLKPSNLMVTPSGHSKILDLGLAVVPGEPIPDDPRVLGGKGYILGTMDYIAPEQARNALDVSPRSDLYALGCSLYFALSGTPPFPGGTSLEKIRRQRHVPPPPLEDMNPAVPHRLNRLVERLMAKNPEDRPASALEVREKLLPFATPVASSRVSVHDLVEEVDRPELHPELWREEGEAELSLESLAAEPAGPVSGSPLEQPEPVHSLPVRWVVAGAVVVALMVLLIVVVLVRNM